MKALRAVLLKLVPVVVLSLALGSAAPPAKKEPAPNHKALQSAPIQLGTSGGNVIDIANGYCCSGTLGALVQIGGGQYILSNTHVFAGDSVGGGNGVIAAEGDDISHPGNVDTGCGVYANIIVADLTNWSALVPGGISKVDASIAEVRTGQVRADGSILQIGVLNSTTALPFPGQAVKKSGRTSGLTKSKVDSINATINVNYSDECAGTSFKTTFTGQVLIQNRGSKFLQSGDSGSLLVEDVLNYPRAVGLLFAGNSTIAVANPIGDVLTYFGATMVGEPTGSTKQEASSEGSLSPSQLARAMRLQQLNERALTRVPGAIGHAIGIGTGRPVIKILVETITAETLAEAPDEIEGIPVVVEEIGPVFAF
jgi:hypothetical protein